MNWVVYITSIGLGELSTLKNRQNLVTVKKHYGKYELHFISISLHGEFSTNHTKLLIC